MANSSNPTISQFDIDVLAAGAVQAAAGAAMLR
jgi:hypothetical protein